MACFLRVIGDFSPLALIETVGAKADRSWTKGEATAFGGVNDVSGIQIVVSHAELDEFQRQSHDALHFLQSERQLITKLLSHSGVWEAWLDFGVAQIDRPMQSLRIPAALIALAGTLGLGIEISIFVVDDPARSAKVD